MKVFMADITTIAECEYHILMNYVSDQRLQKASKYKFRSDAIRCIYSEILVRYAFHKCNIELEMCEWGFNEYGKPCIRECPNLHFNISHSGKWIVVAISEGEIGVDIEAVINDNSSIIYNFFSEKEKSSILTENTKNRNEKITQLWTMKESYMKYRGLGLFMDLSSFSVDINSNSVCIEGILETGINIYSKLIEQEYYLSLCGQGVLKTIEKIDVEELLFFAKNNPIKKDK